MKVGTVSSKKCKADIAERESGNNERQCEECFVVSVVGC